MGKKRKTIGIIIDTMDGAYQTKMIQGFIKYAEEKDFDLLFFSGMAMKPPDFFNVQHNVIFNLVNQEYIDGVILVLSSLEIYMGKEGINKISNMFQSIPLVSVSIKTQGAYNIVIDNKASMELLVEHMIKEHGVKEMAFISGPLQNEEAITRYEGYKSALKKHNLKFDPKNVYEGHFLEKSGKHAIDYFLKYNRILPETIISANDDMAIGAYFRIQELGYEIPKDVKITGFDNIEATNSISPPCTTINQPNFLMCKKAINYLYNAIVGKPTSKTDEYIEGELIIRESCGCFKVVNKNSGINKVRLRNSIDYYEACDRFISNINNKVNVLVEKIINSINPPLSEHVKYELFSKILITGLKNDIKNRIIEGEFIETLNEMLNYSINRRYSEVSFTRFIIDIREYILQFATHSVIYDLVQEMFFVASILAGNIANRKTAMNEYHFKHMYIMSRDIVQQLNSAKSLQDIIQILKDTIPIYRISQCYLCLYDEPIESTSSTEFIFPETVNLVMGYNNSTYFEGGTFLTKDMLPIQYMKQAKRQELVFMALFTDYAHFGYIVFSVDGLDALIYETIREQISQALMSERLYTRRKKAEVKLEIAVKELEVSNRKLGKLSITDDLTGIFNRRGFYQRAESFFRNVNNKAFFVLFADIDGLKHINDFEGHEEGDYAIKKTASLLSELFTREDIFARVSGDEFIAIIVSKKNEDEIKGLVKDIKSSFERHNELVNKDYELNISVGYADYTNMNQRSLDELIRIADGKLYREKMKKKRLNY